MKKTAVFLAIMLANGAFAQDSKSIKEDISSGIFEAITIGKDALSGVVDGIEKGRKSDKAQDNFLVVSDKESLNKYLKIKGYSVEKLDGKNIKITLAVSNDNNQTVRITGLKDIRSLILIDSEGFASPLEGDDVSRKEIVIFEKTSTKASFVASNIDEIPKYLRILGEDVLLPAVK